MSLCLVFANLLWVHSAWAAPARVKVFEASAYQEPSETSPAVHTFVENTDVSVSEAEVDGWRKVRLPDGGLGWIKATDVTVGEAAVPLAPAPPVSPQNPPVRAAIFIKDLDHLAEMVKPDKEVHPMAVSLASKQAAGRVVLGGSLLGGGALMLFPLLAAGSCTEDDDSCESGDGLGLVLAGAVLMGVGTLVGFAMLPDREDLLDVLNAWNRRHPQEPFSIESNTVSVR